MWFQNLFKSKPKNPYGITDELFMDVTIFIQKDELINAIRHIRAKSGLGLKVSKSIVDCVKHDMQKDSHYASFNAA